MIKKSQKITFSCNFENFFFWNNFNNTTVIGNDINGNFKFNFGQNCKLLGPYSLTFNSKRELLVSDSKNNRIQIFKCNGQFIKEITGPFYTNWGISVDLTNDNILVADFIHEQVHALDCNGKLI